MIVIIIYNTIFGRKNVPKYKLNMQIERKLDVVNEVEVIVEASSPSRAKIKARLAGAWKEVNIIKQEESAIQDITVKKIYKVKEHDK